jgi:Subtilisin-like serine proteases
MLLQAINVVRTDGRAKIMNMSLSGDTYILNEKRAIQRAIDSGITVVAAMGNLGTNIKEYPAAYNIPGLIAVGSTTEAGVRSVFSNYGPWQDVAAPGSAILSTVPGSYSFMEGTSQATPIVSGVCALYMSVYGNPGPVAMEQIIRSATTNGVIDASKLFVNDKTAPEIIINANATVAYNSSITISSYNAKTSSTIIYTIDGTTPSAKDGELNGSTLKYNNSTGIKVTSANGFVPGQKMTIKAACVNGEGILSNVVSKSFTVGYAAATGVEILNAPSSIIPGTSTTLEFKVLPAEAEQKVTWSISSRTGCYGTTIDSKTGLLNVAAGDSGSVTVKAQTGNGKSKTAVIQVISKEPVSSLILDYSKCELGVAYDRYYQVALTPTARDRYGAIIYPDYQWKSSNEKVATVDNNGLVKAVGKGTATITCTALDGSKKVAKCSVTVNTLLDALYISGQYRIAPGKSATFKAEVYPATANNKKVEWSIDSAPSGVTVSKTGKVTVPLYVQSGTIILRATALDKSARTTTKEISIAPLATSISIYVNGEKTGGGGYVIDRITGTVKSATLWLFRTEYWGGEENDFCDSYLPLTARATVSGNVSVPTVWSSSNEKVATVSIESQGPVVHAVSPGSATITCKAADGSGKKATVSIKVIIPASGITVISGSKATAADDNKLIAPGKSVTNKAVVSSAFGKPTSTKVEWGLYVYVTDSNNNELTSIENEIIRRNLASVSSSGTLSTKSDIAYYSSRYNVRLNVLAKTVDGTGLSGGVSYYVSAEATQKLVIGDFYPLTYPYSHKREEYLDCLIKDRSGMGGYYFTSDGSTNPSKISGYVFNRYGNYVTSGKVSIPASFGKVDILIPIYFSYKNYYPEMDYIVNSSNPDVAGAVYNYDGSISIITNNEGKTGTAKITVTSTDGSNKSVSITVKLT